MLQTEKFKAAIEKPPGVHFDPFSIDAQGFHMPQQRVQQVPVFKQQEPNKTMNGYEKFYQQTNPVEYSQSGFRQIIGSGGLSDNDFFHLTCHIDPLLKRKIENGEYVDLDKLLPKDNTY